MRQLYNSVITRDSHTYYRFIHHAYDRGYILVGRHDRVLAVESSSATTLDMHHDLILQICRDSATTQVLRPVRRLFSIVDPVTDSATRRLYMSANLEPPQKKFAAGQ